MIQNTKRGLNRKLKKLPFVKDWYDRRKFWVERDLINGRTHQVVDHPSILHFSINKAATQYTKRILVRCAQENGLLPVQLSAYAWNHDFPYLFKQTAAENESYQHIFRPNGYVYTVFGGFVEGIPQLDRYRIIVMVRDPRDVLVSGYFSYAHSHALPPEDTKAEEFLAFRNRIQGLSVDEYVLELSQDLHDRLQKYVILCQQNPDVCVLKYETMIADFPSWLDELLMYCDLQISDALRTTLLEEADRSRNKKKEEISEHRRQVTPGDHERKLQPDTIAYLNDFFADIMEQFQYPKEVEMIDER